MAFLENYPPIHIFGYGTRIYATPTTIYAQAFNPMGAFGKNVCLPKKFILNALQSNNTDTDADGNIILFPGWICQSSDPNSRSDVIQIRMWCWAWLSWVFLGCDWSLLKCLKVKNSNSKVDFKKPSPSLKIETLWKAPSLQMFYVEHRSMRLDVYLSYMPRYLGSAMRRRLIFGLLRLCWFSCRPCLHIPASGSSSQANSLNYFLNSGNFVYCWGHLYLADWNSIAMWRSHLPCRWCSPPFMGSRLWRTWEDSKLQASLSRHGYRGRSNHADLTRMILGFLAVPTWRYSKFSAYPVNFFNFILAFRLFRKWFYYSSPSQI